MDDEATRLSREIRDLLSADAVRGTKMETFSLMGPFVCDRVLSGEVHAGEIYHVDHNERGGSNMTPVGRYFAWKDPGDVENFNPHWRVDCFVRIHPLAPDPMPIGEALVGHLLREGLCSEPLWLSVHRSEELDGKPYGEVFQED